MNNKVNILFINNSIADIDFVKFELNKQGLEFYSETIDTIEKLRSLKYLSNWDIVLMNFHFLNSDIYEIINFIRQVDEFIPIIVISDKVGIDIVIKLIKEGANNFIFKKEIYRLNIEIQNEISQAIIKRENKNLTYSFVENHQKLLNQLTITNQLIDAIPNPIYFKNLEGKYIMCNTAFANIFGVAKNQIIGKTVYDFTQKIYADKYKKLDKEFLNNPEIITDEFEIEYANKSIHYVMFYKAPIYDTSKKLIGMVGHMLDISDKKKAENKLKANQKLLNQLFNNLPGMVYRCKNNKNWTMLFLSNGCKKLTGYNRKELLNDRIIAYADLIEPEYKEYVDTEVQNALNKKTQFQLVYPILNKKNEKVWIHEQGIGVFEHNKLKYLEGICTDITKQKNAELLLKKSEQKYSTLVNNLQEGMGIIDNNEVFTFANVSLENIFASKKNTLVGQSILSFLDDKGKKTVLSHAIRRKNGESSNYNLSITRHDNKKRIIRISVSPYFDLDGEVVGAICLAIDITAQRKVEADLRKRFKYEKLMFQISNQFIDSSNFADKLQSTLNELGKIINAKRIHIIYQKENELKLLSKWQSDDSLQQLNTSNKYTASDLDWFIEKIKNNELININTKDLPNKASVIKNIFIENEIDNYMAQPFSIGDNVLGVIGIVNVQNKDDWSTNDFILIRSLAELLGNVIQRKFSEDKISDLNNKLKVKNKELEEFVYTTSHDLRSPLINVLGFGEELTCSITEILNNINELKISNKGLSKIKNIMEQDIPVMLKYIKISMEKMDTMLKGLLTLSRTGRDEIILENINMNKMIESVIQSFNNEITKNNITIKTQKLPNCYSDNNLLYRVFSNLISNAIKYKHQTRDCHISISGKIVDNKVIYSFKDNGIGIPKSEIDKIFQIFYRINSQNSYGNGIGLAIVKKIIDKLEGKISVESEIDKSTTFYITLKNEKT
ncbi:MAG: PAS domain S-box protein [Chlorobi bacterium]|nr:PAS domain S-box protein [Chlorobiota bacterium]